ncbi:DNA repair protein RecO [Pleurocapsa sp. FMAR1]|uniref:DNA repair protein RecO n=1 Tax=Pleurocapsa sp. FMAR1 TaxID=3040204 RepID=UPI0029C9857D|nr:DNA repair protein RecO [Pleurocapsa sp. FMAR1]
MNQKYKATGIILKGSSIKENDRLVTILTPEYGMIRAVAPGAKKLKSSLRGRTELFVVNELLIIKGRSLDKIIQADTQYTYPGLSRDIGKLAAAQYLAELTIFLAVDEQPQPELYELLNEHLRRLEKFPVGESVYPYLAQGVFHLIAIAGLSPQVFDCCLTQQLITPDLTSAQWRVGFSFEAGGIVDLRMLKPEQNRKTGEHDDHSENYNSRLPKIDHRVNSLELSLLQQLNHHQLPPAAKFTAEQLNNFDLHTAWIRVERILREYIQYHIGRTIRSANLVDNLYVEF